MSHNICSRRMAWWIALAMTAALYALIFLTMDVRFAMNDDAYIQRTLMGYETGTPATFHLYLHALLVWPIHLLQRLWPLTPWYSYVQLMLLFVSLVVIARSLMQRCLLNRQPLWTGAVLAAAFFIAFGLEYTTQFTFTYTSAMLGAAAVMQLFSIDYEHCSTRQIVRGVLGAAGLVSLCWAMRLDAPWPAIACCGLAFVYLFLEYFGTGRTKKRNAKPMVLALLGVAAVLACMAGTRIVEVHLSDSARYRDWHSERSLALDYGGLSKADDAVLRTIGWNDQTLQLAQNWCFLDGSISTENMRAINQHAAALDTRSFADQLRSAKQLILSRMNQSAYAFRLLGTAALCGIAAAIGALFCTGKRIRLWFVLMCAAAGFGVMLLYLALEGRLPMRAVSAAALPVAAVVFAIVPACVPKGRLSRVFLPVLVFGVLLYASIHASPVVQLYQRTKSQHQPGQAYADIESYALEHPDCLLVTDGSFAAQDVRAFPDYTNGLPHNITSWGGWHFRSPESEQQLARYQIDAWNFDPESFLRDDVFFVTDQVDTPPGLLLGWLSVRTGKDIGWEVYARSGQAYILHFYEI